MEIESLSSKELFKIVEQAWHCYSDAPISYWGVSPNTEQLEHLLWFRCNSATQGHSVLLGVHKRLAVRLTSDMFQITSNALSVADMVDAVGEITNIIKGNVNSLFHLEDKLDMPIKLDDEKLIEDFPQMDKLSEVLIDSRGLPFYIAIIGRSTAVMGH